MISQVPSIVALVLPEKELKTR
ncbi:MAG: hypothetical protein QOH93_720, partial [Chloroflexia bacterium]|nr:hypothetical protein [Chloroflexia bacterium]